MKSQVSVFTAEVQFNGMVDDVLQFIALNYMYLLF